MKNENESKQLHKGRVHLSIDFGNIILPVVECDDGYSRVPLKPIAEEVGVQWETQRRKTLPEKYIGRRLGTKTTMLKHGGKAQTCIRLDRVTTFLNSLNPENIRGMGNSDSANWLENKHKEWDDALHAYECASGLVKFDSKSKGQTLDSLFRNRNQAVSKKEKLAITVLINRELKQLGVDPENLTEEQMQLKFI